MRARWAFVSPQTYTLRARQLQGWIRGVDQEGFRDERLGEYVCLLQIHVIAATDPWHYKRY